MKRSAKTVATVTVGQLATRWGVSADRIRGLIDAGQIQGAFQIPSAGRFGSTVKIPLCVVESLEADWQVGRTYPKRRRSPETISGLRHLPGLTIDPESDVEYPGAGHGQDGRIAE